MSILLMTIFGFFIQSKKTEARFLQAQDIVSSREHFQVKLSHALSTLVPLDTVYKQLKKPHSSVYLDEDNHLCLFFDNGIDPEPRLSGPVMGKLWLNKEEELIFSLFSLDKEPLHRSEILQKHVQELSFDFLGNLPSKKPSSKTLPALYTHWPKNITKNPSMICIKVLRSKATSPQSFAFFLPAFDAPITYYERLH